MRKFFLVVSLMIVFLVLCIPQSGHAQAEIIELVKNATIKVIRAIDLKIQRLQNKTIWLQNAQQTIENVLSKAKLTGIGDWVDKQKDIVRRLF